MGLKLDLAFNLLKKLETTGTETESRIMDSTLDQVVEEYENEAQHEYEEDDDNDLISESELNIIKVECREYKTVII